MQRIRFMEAPLVSSYKVLLHLSNESSDGSVQYQH